MPAAHEEHALVVDEDRYDPAGQEARQTVAADAECSDVPQARQIVAPAAPLKYPAAQAEQLVAPAAA